MSGRPKEYLVLSDSHGQLNALSRVARQINFRPTAILFLGDGARDLRVFEDFPALAEVPIFAVSGNCDGFFVAAADREPTMRLLPIGRHKILMMHGHLYGVRSGVEAAAQQALSQGADILLYGHTHIAAEEWRTVEMTDADGTAKQQRLLIANPGSVGEPRDGCGRRFGVLTVGDGGVLFSHGTID